MNKGFSIYMIRNTMNDRVYIGETIQVVEHRIANHRRRLELGSHEKPALQADWNTFGSEAFEFTLLRYYHEELMVGARRRIERQWMDALQATHPDHGYNTRFYGRSLFSRMITPREPYEVQAAITSVLADRS